MAKPIPVDLTGQKFGLLTVEKIGSKGSNNKTQWWCRCDCGNKTIIRGESLKSGHTESCGCANVKARAEFYKRKRYTDKQHANFHKIFTRKKPAE